MRRWSGRLALSAGGTAAVAVYAWWATGRRPFTTAATVAVVGAGAVAMAIGHTRRAQNDSRPGLRGAGSWLVLLAALAGWQLLAYLQEPRSEHPTLSSLTNTMLDTHTGRALAFVAWLVGGHLLARR